MGSYQHTTLLDARTKLYQRLGSPSNTFWIDPELTFYIQLAIRTFNQIGRFYKNSFPVQTVANTTFYNLMDSTQNPSTLLAPSLTDQNLINLMQYLLMEPANTWTGTPGSSPGYTWNGTAQFTMSDLVGALQRKRDEFFLLTGMVLAYIGDLPATPPPVQTVQLPDTIIDVRRVAWKDLSPTFLNPPQPASYYPLTRSDKLSFDLGQPDWNLNASIPTQYSVQNDPLLTLQLAPIASILGTVNVVGIQAGFLSDPNLPPDQSLDPSTASGTGVVLGIPDDFCDIPMWGALYDLLSKDGEAKDEQRASYGLQRWQQGIEIARLAISLMRAEVGGLSVPLSSAWAADHANPQWQNGTGTPTNIITFGYNLIAMTPQPAALTHQVTMDCVINATVPVLDTDFLQVGREHLDPILDYAQHIASFKQGSDEFSATQPLLQHFLEVAVDNNSRLKANGKLVKAMFGKTEEEMRDRPMRGREEAA